MIKPYLFVLLGFLLLYDFISPYIVSSGPKLEEQTATTAEKGTSSHKFEQAAGLQELLRNSQGGVYISYCTS